MRFQRFAQLLITAICRDPNIIDEDSAWLEGTLEFVVQFFHVDKKCPPEALPPAGGCIFFKRRSLFDVRLCAVRRGSLLPANPVATLFRRNVPAAPHDSQRQTD